MICVLWFVYEICGLITWYVSCCAKCQFHPFLPASSISQPPSWKMLPVAKTPENSTLRAYRLILPAYDTIRSHFLHYRTKIWKMQIKIDISKLDSPARVTWYAFFGKHYLHSQVNTIYPFTTISHIFTSFQLWSHSLQLYRYSNTITTMQHIVTLL